MKTKLLTLLLVLMTLCASAQNTIKVTNLNDSGPGSLRQAVAGALAKDTVDLRGLTGSISLISPIQGKSLNFIGDGYDRVIIDGSQSNLGLFNFSSFATVTFHGLSFKNSKAQTAFNFKAEGSRFVIRNCLFENNKILFSFEQFIGSVEIYSSTFIKNSSVILLHLSDEPVTTGIGQTYVLQSTFYNVPGLIRYSNSSILKEKIQGVTNINNSTFLFCGYIVEETREPIPLAKIVLNSNILHGFSGMVMYPNSYLITGSNNIGVSNGIEALGTYADPKIASLTYSTDKGPTPVFELLENSPAIDRGINPNNFKTDQVGGQRVKGNRIDIGSFETEYTRISPKISLGPDIVLCTVDSVMLNAGTDYKDYLWSTGATGPILKVKLPGKYSVIGKDEFGIFSSDTIQVVDGKPKPEITAEVGNCDQSVILSTTDFNSYVWSTNSTEKSILVNQTGTYSLEVTNGLGCKGSDQIAVKINADPSCQPAAITPLTAIAVCSDYPNLFRRWKITNPNAGSMRVDWEIVGTIEKTWIDIPPGDSYLTTITVPSNSNKLKIYWHNEKGEIKSLQQTSITTRCKKPSNTSAREASETTDEVSNEDISLKAYPNPGKYHITIEVVSTEEKETSLQIISAMGITHSQSNVRLATGSNFIVQDVSNLAQGTYVIKAGRQSIRFIKD